MGKFLKKSKTTGEVSLNQVSQHQSPLSLGVRTRAKTLALRSTQKLASLSPYDASSYLQLRSRRLEKTNIGGQSKRRRRPNTNLRTGSRLRVGSGCLEEEGGGDGDELERHKNEEGEIKSGDLGIEASFGENVLELEGSERKMWEWHDDDFVLQEDTNLNVPGSLWNDLGQNDESLSYMFDEITPVKVCGDLGYDNTNSVDVSRSKKEITDDAKHREKFKLSSSQVKRRRMLQYDSEILPIPYCNEEMPPAILEEKEREDTIEEAFSNMSQWVSGEDTSSSGYESLHQSSEGWLADCLNDAEIQINPDDGGRSGASEVHNAGFSATLPVQEATTGQKHRPLARQNVVLKGKKSYMQTPTKTTSSVVYPFAFIKPCGVHGDVTLRDINQRICTPPKPKQKEDLAAIYPTSAFSGKPVVNQMKIHTEGGKGCITIMRTKG